MKSSFEGSVHHILVVEDEAAPLSLYINAGTGRIAKLTTTENDALRRDVPLEVLYYGWQSAGEGLLFPAELYVAYDGDIVHKEIRSSIEINAELAADLFELPAEADPVFDADLAVRGETHHQFLQTFAARGFPRDGLQTNVDATELAPGVFHLRGGSHNSMVVEQDDGVIVVEAPLDETRSEAVISWVEENFPDKPISHVISSHHHVDHSAGLRSYVAEGVTAVIHESAASFFEDVFLASSTVTPDSLAENPVEANIETVPADGGLTLEDGTNAVEVYPISNPHAEDLVITYAADAGVVFIVDLYSPNPDAPQLPPGAQIFNNALTELDLDVSVIAGGHGGAIPI